MDRDELLRRIKSALADAFGDRFHSVILYGSEARGDPDPDSDIDLLVVLESQVLDPLGKRLAGIQQGVRLTQPGHDLKRRMSLPSAHRESPCPSGQ